MLGLILAATPAIGIPVADVTHVQRTQEEVAAYIMVLKPKMPKWQAKRLGRIICYWADYYQVDAYLMVAIIRTESNFDSVKACHPAPRKGTDAETCDHGLAQINEVWVSQWSLDPEKLVNDDSYNIYVQARLLAWLRRYYGHEEGWYGRYHSGHPHLKAKYLEKLDSFLALASAR